MKKLSVLAAAAVFALGAFGLAGCESGPSIEELIREDIASEFDAVKSDNSDFIAGIEEGAGDDLALLGVSAEDFANAYLDGFDYEITGVDVDDEAGTAVAHVTMTCKSMGDIVVDFQTAFEEKVQTLDLSSMTEDDLYKLGGEVMLECAKSAEARDVDVDLRYVETEENEWNIDDSAEEELTNAMLG